MSNLASFELTGTNNSRYPISKDQFNALLSRLERGIPVTPQDFGAVADNATDCLSAFNAALAFLASAATLPLGNSVYLGAPRLFVPAGRYYLSGTIELKATVIIEGEGAGIAHNNGAATELRFPAATTGLRVNRVNTYGGTVAAVTTGADGSVIRGISFLGPSSGSGNYDGIRLHARATIDHCSTYGFARSGIAVVAASGANDATEGNANCWRIIGGRHEYHKVAGIYVEGADANAGYCIGADVSFGGQYGIFDNSFLGNTYVGCHAEYNGTGTSGYEGTTNNTSSLCWYNSRYYTVMPGQASSCSTNAPTGTDYGNTYWGFVGGDNGTGASNAAPAWTSGRTWAEGGAYYAKSVVAGTVFDGCYVEGGQSPAKGNAPALFVGGSLTGRVHGSAIQAQNDSGALSAPKLKAAYRSSTGVSTAQVGGSKDVFAYWELENGQNWQWDSDGSLLFLKRGGTGALYVTGSNIAGGSFGRSAAVPGALVPNVLMAGGFGGREISYGSAAPTSGERGQGDIVFNTGASAGGKVGWVCTAAGTPGTWKAFGAIDA